MSADATGTRSVHLINNDAGTAATVEIGPETRTVSDLFRSQNPGKEMSNYMVRANRAPVDTNYELQPGDRVAFTPTKVEGADST